MTRPDETERDKLNLIERLPVPNEKRGGEPLYAHISLKLLMYITHSNITVMDTILWHLKIGKSADTVIG